MIVVGGGGPTFTGKVIVGRGGLPLLLFKAGTTTVAHVTTGVMVTAETAGLR